MLRVAIGVVVVGTLAIVPGGWGGPDAASLGLGHAGSDQWYLASCDNARAHQVIPRTGDGVTIGILGTGTDDTHRDTPGVVLSGLDLVGHNANNEASSLAAAPHALIWSQHPNPLAGQMAWHLCIAGHVVAMPGFDKPTGWGVRVPVAARGPVNASPTPSLSPSTAAPTTTPAAAAVQAGQSPGSSFSAVMGALTVVFAAAIFAGLLIALARRRRVEAASGWPDEETSPAATAEGPLRPETPPSTPDSASPSGSDN